MIQSIRSPSLALRRSAPSSFVVALGALLSLGTGCAAGLHGTERTYARPDLAEVPLRSIDVVVFVAGPPRVASQKLDSGVFPPPALDEPLARGREERGTSDALAAALGARLRSAGFAVRVLRFDDAPADGPLVEPQPPLPGAPIVTSTAAVGTTTRARSSLELGVAPSPAPIVLERSTTLASLLASSAADGVLVVRAVPVDRFSIDFGQGIRTEIGPLGKERVEDVRPEPREGRLLLGQAFLFDRRSGVRLWTKQLPDFPEAGRLTPGHPFLGYGVVYEPKDGVAPPPAERAAPAAQAFVGAMFANLPSPTDGRAEARAKLDATDATKEERVQRFLDEGRFALELGTRWGTQRVELGLELGAEALPSLGNGAIAPSGVVGVVPRATYLAPGGLVLSFALPLGIAPGSFARSYHRDNPNPDDLADPEDRTARVQVSGATTVGAELSVGQARALSRRLYVVPSIGAFADVWSIDAGPSTVVDGTSKVRLGGLAGLDLWLRTDDDSAFFARLGGDLRGGVDLDGQLVTGFELAASLGIFL
ncbi:hypothetical protein L6R52_20280 [Myxococcota bacterium]|nr:hypothetical protein [Myxococcota bacterium]